MRIVSYAINYSNPYFNGAKRKNERFERTVVGILQDYINFKISKEEIKRKISELNSQAEILKKPSLASFNVEYGFKIADPSRVVSFLSVF